MLNPKVQEIIAQQEQIEEQILKIQRQYRKHRINASIDQVVENNIKALFATAKRLNHVCHKIKKIKFAFNRIVKNLRFVNELHPNNNITIINYLPRNHWSRWLRSLGLLIIKDPPMTVYDFCIDLISRIYPISVYDKEQKFLLTQNLTELFLLFLQEQGWTLLEHSPERIRMILKLDGEIFHNEFSALFSSQNIYWIMAIGLYETEAISDGD